MFMNVCRKNPPLQSWRYQILVWSLPAEPRVPYMHVCPQLSPSSWLLMYVWLMPSSAQSLRSLPQHCHLTKCLHWQGKDTNWERSGTSMSVKTRETVCLLLTKSAYTNGSSSCWWTAARQFTRPWLLPGFELLLPPSGGLWHFYWRIWGWYKCKWC